MIDDDTASAPAAATDDLRPADPLPDGEYAIVEVLGHRTIIGRVTEVERFGTKLMAIEPIFAGALLPAVLIGGASLYQYTPCPREVAAARAPTRRYGLPSSIAAMLPPEEFSMTSRMIVMPARDAGHDDLDDPDFFGERG